MIPATRKPALDAITDQALAVLRDGRGDVADDLLDEVAADLAAILAVQFPHDREIAGRVVMGVTLFLTGMVQKTAGRPDPERMCQLLALTAEQVVREAATP
jgi:butyrate kinase